MMEMNNSLHTKNSNLEASLLKLQTTINHEKEKNTNLQAAVSQLSTSMQTVSAHGSAYIRWGRNQCEGAHTELVYTGFTAGQPHYEVNLPLKDRYGGPSNMLCLPNNPEKGNKTWVGYSYLYGTEYEETFFQSDAVDEDVPCALCWSTNSFASIMIPGRKSCYQGWKVEYYGYLASGSYAQKASSYICVDTNPEFIQGGMANKDGHRLYGTSTKCGSLPCPPYGDNLAVNCVVCSK